MNTPRPEIINSLPLTIKCRPHESEEVMFVIIYSYLTLNFKRSQVCQKIILLSVLMILLYKLFRIFVEIVN